MEPTAKSTIANFPKGTTHCSESGKNNTLEFRKEDIEKWLADLKQYFMDIMLDKEHLAGCSACKAGIFCGHIALAAEVLGIPKKDALELVVKTRNEALEEYLCVNLIMDNPEGKNKEEQGRHCAKGHQCYREESFSHTKYFYDCRSDVCSGDYKPRGPKQK